MVHHGRGLFRWTKDEKLVDAIKTDYRTAEISDTDMAMLRYADKLTRHPCECEAADVEELRTVGFENDEILDIAQVVAYYAFVNRLACGLGVELEPYWNEEP